MLSSGHKTLKILAQILAAAAIIGIYFYLSGAEQAPENFNGTVVSKTLGLESIDLIDHDGKPSSLTKYKGKWVLLFFGYTHCPDICPTTLAYLTREFAELKELRKYTQVVMVSVDPKRDTPEDIKAYVQGFESSFVGTTGTEENLRSLVKMFDGFFHYHQTSSAIQYTVEHPGDIFLISPDGDWYAVYRPPLTNTTISDDLRHLILKQNT